MNVQINAMHAGDTVEGFYLIKEPQIRSATDGEPYLTAKLGDQTGSIEAKMWKYTGNIGSADNGKIVKVRGKASEYKGKSQLVIEKLRLRTEQDAVDISILVPTAPIDVDQALSEIDTLLGSITDPDYRNICETMLAAHIGTFSRIPAALRVHHAFLCGLLMHTLYMMRMADFLAGLYNSFIDRDLILAATFLHDFGKVQEFLYSDTGLVTDYSMKGQLLGHLVMGAMEVAQLSAELGIPEEKSVLLQHLILSHHGEPEFGAAVRPACAESELLAQIDMLDSKMEQIRELMEKTANCTFSEKSFFLGGRRYFKHTIGVQ